MYILLILVSIILILTTLVALVPLKVRFRMDSEDLLNSSLNFSWLNPFLNLTIQNENNNITKTFYLFNKVVLKNSIYTQKNKKHSSKDLLEFMKQIKLKYADLKTSYGFNDPSITGIVYGTTNIVSQYINLDFFTNEPDFYTNTTYFNINAYLELSITPLIIGYFRYNSLSYVPQPAYQNK